MIDVALSITALIASGLTLELFATSTRMAVEPEQALAEPGYPGEELQVCNPS